MLRTKIFNSFVENLIAHLRAKFEAPTAIIQKPVLFLALMGNYSARWAVLI